MASLSKEQLKAKLLANPSLISEAVGVLNTQPEEETSPSFNLRGGLAGALRGFTGQAPDLSSVSGTGTGNLSFIEKEIAKRQLDKTFEEPETVMVDNIEYTKQPDGSFIKTAELPKTEKEKREAIEFKTKQEETARVKQEKESQFERNAEDTLNLVKDLREQKDMFGRLASKVPDALLPPGERQDFRMKLGRLISQLTLGVMADLKAQSKTGATGFGQLSNKELAILQNAATELREGTTQERAIELLKEIEDNVLTSMTDRMKKEDKKVEATKVQDGVIDLGTID